MVKYLSILFITLAGLSCNAIESTPEAIYGHWETKKWIIDKTGAPIRGKMDFLFERDGHYTVDYGSQLERGTFSVQGERLYTTEDGQARKYVKIAKLTADSLIIGMNRAGRLETVVLTKQK